MRTKRSIALCLALIFVFLSVFPTMSFAEDISDSRRPTGANFTCEYDKKNAEIKIGITVTHDLFISYKDYNIELYRIPVGMNVIDIFFNDDITPIASSEMSIKFSCSVSVVSSSDMFSRYVFVFVSKEGNVHYTGPELYPSVRSEYAPQRDHFKGIDISGNDTAINGIPSVSVIDVELNRLLNSDYMGFLYTVDSESIFFERSYIEYLDKRIQNLSAANSSVYLRLLITDGEGNYVSPRDISEATIRRLYAACDFLAARYSSSQRGGYGKIRGVIIGKAVDTLNLGGEGDAHLKTYAEDFARYAMIVANAVRQNIPSADIVVPISNVNCYSNLDRQTGVGALLLDNICSYLDEHYADTFEFSLMLEAENTPFGITNENIKNGVDIDAIVDDDYISAQNIGDFLLYLEKLGKRYDCSPKTFMYYWDVPEDLSGNALSCAYVYSYYKLIVQSKATGFIVNIDDSENFSDLFNIFKFIDTQYGKVCTSPLLPLFGISDYSEITSPNFGNIKLDTRTHIIKDSLDSIPDNRLGEFYYFDYSTNTAVLPWYESIGMSGLSIDYSKVCGRSLKADFERLADGEYTYLLCHDDYPENYFHTPYIALNFTIESENSETEGLFEVRFEIGDEGHIIESTKAVEAGKNSQIILDISSFAKSCYGSYLRIAVRPISDKSETYSFYLSSIVGVSPEYDNEELEELIKNDRLEIRDLISNDDDVSSTKNTATLIFVIVLISAILGVMLFVFLRYEDDE